MPKQLLFGDLWKKCHGTKKRWRDQLAGDLQAMHESLKDGWYQLCQNWEAWCASCYGGNEVASCRKHNTCAANRQLQDSHFD